MAIERNLLARSADNKPGHPFVSTIPPFLENKWVYLRILLSGDYAGGTVFAEESSDGRTWTQLSDVRGAPARLSAADGAREVVCRIVLPQYIRANQSGCTAGNAAVSLLSQDYQILETTDLGGAGGSSASTGIPASAAEALAYLGGSSSSATAPKVVTVDVLAQVRNEIGQDLIGESMTWAGMPAPVLGKYAMLQAKDGAWEPGIYKSEDGVSWYLCLQASGAASAAETITLGVTAQNTIANLPFTPTSPVTFEVNGVVVRRGITNSGRTVSVDPAVLGYNLASGADLVTATFSH